MLKIQNTKIMAKLQSAPNCPSKPIEKENPFSRNNYYDKNKENDFKDEMLRLPIFQKNKHQVEHCEDLSPRTLEPSNTASQVSQHSRSNKKKAEFEKKIRKFIESDSPHRPQQPQKKGADYSFEN